METGIGFLAAIIAGGLAGWIAEKIMDSRMGVLSNIVLGMIGSIIGGVFLGLFGGFDREASFFSYLAAGVVGACLLIAIWRLVRGRSVKA